MKETDDGGYVIVETNQTFGEENKEGLFIKRLGPNFEILWENSLVSFELNTLKTIAETVDGGYMIGWEAPQSSEISLFSKYDAELNLTMNFFK